MLCIKLAISSISHVMHELAMNIISHVMQFFHVSVSLVF